jgi:hypothetical protein
VRTEVGLWTEESSLILVRPDDKTLDEKSTNVLSNVIGREKQRKNSSLKALERAT